MREYTLDTVTRSELESLTTLEGERSFVRSLQKDGDRKIKRIWESTGSPDKIISATSYRGSQRTREKVNQLITSSTDERYL